MNQFQCSNQLNEASAKSIPKPIARSASLQRFTNSCNYQIHTTQTIPYKKCDPINNKETLNRALKDKLNSFNIFNQTARQKPSQCLKSRNLIVNKLLQKNNKQNLIQTKLSKQNRHAQTGGKTNIQSFYHKHQNIQKLINLKEQKQQNQLKECTFNPHINTKTQKQIDKKPNPLQFYQEQKQFQKRKQDKIQEMRQIIQKNKNKENSFQPQITHRDLSKNKGQVYQRLYQMPKNYAQNTETCSVAMRQKSWRQSSNPKRSGSTNKIKSIMSRNDSQSNNNNVKCFSQMNIPLQTQTEKTRRSRPNSVRKTTQFKKYTTNQEDISNAFMKRMQMNKKLDCQELLRKNKINEQQRARQQRKASIHKNKNEQIVITKFIKQVVQVIIKTHFSYDLNYLQLSAFLEQMNFIDANGNSGQRTLISQIWRLLNGNANNFVTILNLTKVLCCIQGATKPNIIEQLINFYIIQSPLSEIKNMLPDTVQNVLIFQQNDMKIIKQRFKNLSINRIRLGQSQLLKQVVKEQHSFRPVISELSVQLAQKYRERVLQQSQQLLNQHKIDFNIPEGGLIDHTELLLLDQKRRIHKLKQMRDDKERQQKSIEQQSMIQHQSSCMKTQRSEQSNNIQSCFQQSSIYSKKNQPQRSLYLNSYQESVHKQVSSNSYQESSKKTNTCYEKSSYQQQKSAKYERPTKKIYNETQFNTPLLYLNVNMEGNQNTKIPVFKNDTLKTMTEKVRVIMKIQDGEEQRKKLSYILKAQIQPVLVKMGLQNSIQII